MFSLRAGPRSPSIRGLLHRFAVPSDAAECRRGKLSLTRYIKAVHTFCRECMRS